MDAIPLDNSTLVVIVLAAVIIVVALIFRQKIRLFLKGPGGTELNLDASNQRAITLPGVNITDVKAGESNLRAHDRTGRGANVQRVNKVEGDIDVTVTPPPSNTPPKP